ncbi:hypothetical protein EJB05_22547, partial [Eragrostis curvula]
MDMGLQHQSQDPKLLSDWMHARLLLSECRREPKSKRTINCSNIRQGQQGHLAVNGSAVYYTESAMPLSALIPISGNNMHPMPILLSITILPLLLLLTAFKNRKASKNGCSLPPAPWPRLPLMGNLFCFSPTIASLSVVLRRLHDSHGPVVSLWVGRKPAIFISCHDMAHQALVHMGTTFAHRPTSWCSGVNSHGVNSTTYCSRWGLLRRNLSSHLAAASRSTCLLRSSIDRLVKILESVAGEDGGIVAPSEPFRHAVFGFFSALCFGEEVDEDVLGRLRCLHVEIISLIVELDAFHLVPALLQRKLLSAQRRHHTLVTTLISACRRRRDEVAGCDGAEPRCYVDTLLGLGLGEEEMVSLCWEYMNAAVKTTTTALEWIMARLVLHQRQPHATLRAASEDVPGGGGARSPAPPSAGTLPLGSHHGQRLRPTLGVIATLWTEATEFRPERFMEGGEGFGGQKVAKMMPFGAGRRVCPGAAISMTVLQSFVEELVKRFEWKPNMEEAESVDMAEKPGIVSS